MIVLVAIRFRLFGVGLVKKSRYPWVPYIDQEKKNSASDLEIEAEISKNSPNQAHPDPGAMRAWASRNSTWQLGYYARTHKDSTQLWR